MTVSRGDIFYADLRPVVGSEQGGVRPVLISERYGKPLQPYDHCGSHYITVK